MKRFFMLTLLLVLGLVVLSGCASITGETAGQNIDDSTIHAKVTAIIVQDPDTHYFKIDVAVTRGDVVLTGFVNSKAAEDRLLAKINRVQGVKSVKSLLKIEEKK